jgi:cytochrome c biogenesis protein CcmG, thiol:disulfide interchange protein DsbE
MDGTAAAAPDNLRRRPRRPLAILAVAAAVVVIIAVAAVLFASGSPAKARGPLETAKSFRLPELGHTGKYVSLAAYAGRPVIINFFASWCAPCQRETPLLASFYREHHGSVLIIGVDSNDEAAKALAFVKAKGVGYPIAFDGYPAPVTVSYGIVALPQTFMLNAKHQIVQHISGDVTQHELQAWASSLAGAGGT